MRRRRQKRRSPSAFCLLLSAMTSAPAAVCLVPSALCLCVISAVPPGGGVLANLQNDSDAPNLNPPRRGGRRGGAEVRRQLVADERVEVRRVERVEHLQIQVEAVARALPSMIICTGPPPPPSPAPPVGPRCALPAGGGGGGGPIITGPSPSRPPRLNERFRRKLTFHCDAPRALLRPTPAGRSLNTVSPLSSRPVVMLYGGADENCACMLARTPCGSGVLNMKNTRWRMSLRRPGPSRHPDRGCSTAGSAPSRRSCASCRTDTSRCP